MKRKYRLRSLCRRLLGVGRFTVDLINYFLNQFMCECNAACSWSSAGQDVPHWQSFQMVQLDQINSIRPEFNNKYTVTAF